MSNVSASVAARAPLRSPALLLIRPPVLPRPHSFFSLTSNAVAASMRSV